MLQLTSTREQPHAAVGRGHRQAIVVGAGGGDDAAGLFQGGMGADLHVHAGLVGEAVAGVLGLGFGGVTAHGAPLSGGEGGDDSFAGDDG